MSELLSGEESLGLYLKSQGSFQIVKDQMGARLGTLVFLVQSTWVGKEGGLEAIRKEPEGSFYLFST